MAYIGALYYLSNSFQSIIGFGTNLNRFYPQLKNLYEFLDSAKQTRGAEVNEKPYGTGPRSVPNSLSLSVSPEIPGSLRNLNINKNETMFLVSGASLSRLNLDSFIKPLVSAGVDEQVLENSLSFIGKDFSVEMFSYQAYDLRTNLYKDSRFLDYVFERYPDIKDELLNFNIDQSGGDIAQNGKALSTIAKNVFLLNSLMVENAGFKMVEMQMLRQVPSDIVIFFANSLADCYLAIVSDSGPLIDTVMGHVLVIEEGKLIAAGHREWFAKEKANIDARVFKAQQQAQGGGLDNTTLF